MPESTGPAGPSSSAVHFRSREIPRSGQPARRSSSRSPTASIWRAAKDSSAVCHCGSGQSVSGRPASSSISTQRRSGSWPRTAGNDPGNSRASVSPTVPSSAKTAGDALKISGDSSRTRHTDERGQVRNWRGRPGSWPSRAVRKAVTSSSQSGRSQSCPPRSPAIHARTTRGASDGAPGSEGRSVRSNQRRSAVSAGRSSACPA
ncbi:hypothetical protein AMK22_31555 [Streptomyces sp. CB01580]|nr:hypothetical protein AMK22_31555 [Streptomyces sp. CB01580]